VSQEIIEEVFAIDEGIPLERSDDMPVSHTTPMGRKVMGPLRRLLKALKGLLVV
jgi:hypothetical protein